MLYDIRFPDKPP